MARAMWKGSITFGLVNIPVELYSAVRDHRPRFRLLHAKDESPVHYERVCQSEGKPVGWDDLVKGYEYEKGQFVVLTKDDFKTAALEKTKTVDVLDFAKLALVLQLHLVIVSNVYFLGRIGVTIDDVAGRPSSLPVEHRPEADNELEVGNGSWLVEQLFVRQIA